MTAEWSFDSHDLTVDGDYNAIDMLGYYDLPHVRGENIAIPFVAGKTWVQKYEDERTLTLKMAIYGTSLSDLETNIATLQGYFSTHTEAALLHTFADATQETAQAEACNFSVAMHGPYGALATVDFILSVPDFTPVTP